MNELAIIAGPCSVDENNANEIVEISKIQQGVTKAIAGTRVVGLKSRTSIENSIHAMGIDYECYCDNLKMYLNGIGWQNYKTPPSVFLMHEIVKQTGLLISTEVMNPLVQLPSIEQNLKTKMLLWNPSVNQLGWQVYETAHFAAKNNWHVGIKNGKWVGNNANELENDTSVEKTWRGLASYAKSQTQKVILIHRGFDVPNKNTHRSLPLHELALRTKKHTGAKLFFDPSHTYGPKMRSQINEKTIEAMQMSSENVFLYDGILIEVGTSKTDTDQHISVSELCDLVYELSKFRKLVTPEEF